MMLRTLRIRAIALTAWVIVAPDALVASAAAATDENEQLFKAIHDFCLVPGTLDETVRLAMRSRYGARDMGSQRGKPYVREIGFAKLGSGSTLMILTAAERTAPLGECRSVSYSDDAAELMGSLRHAFNLPEPTRRQIDNVWQVTARRAFRGQAMWIDLEYSLQENQRSGGLTLTVLRYQSPCRI
jgi:hypothetical protein